MKQLILLVCALLALSSAQAFEVGDKVWVALPAPDLKSDGYAAGLITDIDKDGVSLDIIEFQDGFNKTLVGSCSMDGKEVPDYEQNLQLFLQHYPLLNEPLEPGKLLSYEQGRDIYLQREQFSTVFYRWLGNSFGANAERSRLGMEYFDLLGDKRTATAFKLSLLQLEANGGDLYPHPLSETAPLLSDMLKQSLAIARSWPESLKQARLQQNSDPGSLDSTDLIALALIKIMQSSSHEMERIEQQIGIAEAVKQWPELKSAAHTLAELKTGK